MLHLVILFQHVLLQHFSQFLLWPDLALFFPPSPVRCGFEKKNVALAGMCHVVLFLFTFAEWNGTSGGKYKRHRWFTDR
jgi:hypothetical protein